MTGSTSVYSPALLMLPITDCFLPPCRPARGFTSTKENDSEMEERLCGGVVLAACGCLSGEGSGSLV